MENNTNYITGKVNEPASVTDLSAENEESAFGKNEKLEC